MGEILGVDIDHIVTIEAGPTRDGELDVVDQVGEVVVHGDVGFVIRSLSQSPV